jgi:hypothetical protein
MKKIWLVTKREYITRVKKKSFLVMTLLSPLLIVLFYGIIFYFSFNKDISDTSKKVLIVDESGNFKNQLKKNSMHMPVWLYLFKRDFLLKNSLFFKVGLLHEDEEFTPRAILKCESIILINSVFYNYIIRKNSITNSKSKIKNSLHIIETCNSLKYTYLKIADIEFRELLLNSLASKYLHAFQISKVFRENTFIDSSANFFKGINLSKKLQVKVALFNFNKFLYFYTFFLINKARTLSNFIINRT